ncbi:hypothetical protein KKA39_02235 [Patescibacteria group bacterium]|nr:hypothetical protein [Patescibacteria group bacterium]
MENSNSFNFFGWPFWITLTIVIVIYFLWENGYLRTSLNGLRNEAKSIARETLNVILYILGYGILLLMFSTLFWDSWVNNVTMFIIANAAILIGILIAYVARKTSFGWLIIIVAVLFFGSTIIDQIKPKKQENDTSIPGYSPITQTGPILIFDGYTPCSPSIDYKFSLETLGDSINLKFPGVADPIFYDGKVDPRAPVNRTTGPVQITSANPNKEARVMIYKVP